MNDFVAVSTGYVVAYLSRDMMSVSRGVATAFSSVTKLTTYQCHQYCLKILPNCFRLLVLYLVHHV